MRISDWSSDVCSSDLNRAYAPLLFDVGTIPLPSEGREQAALDALEGACSAPEKPAAFIVEPLILGAGGMLINSAESLRQLREIGAAHAVHFIDDEDRKSVGKGQRGSGGGDHGGRRIH